jgi:hypothetical protein
MLGAALLFLGLPLTTAVAQNCASCNRGIGETSYLVKDRMDDTQKQVCGDCIVLKSRCYLCSLPVRRDFLELPDGRFLCARDSKSVVLDDNSAQQAIEETKLELTRLFARFLMFPTTNVVYTVEDRVHMEELFQTPGFERQCPSIMGYIRSRVGKESGLEHSISVLSAMPRARLMAVTAHELGHAWLKENVNRDMGRDAIEGFCELIAYKLMEQLGEGREIAYIKSNVYTRGQTGLFIDADRSLGFYTIVQWMKFGMDEELSADDQDRIRRIDQKRAQPVTQTVWQPAPAPAVTPVPDSLTLIGISGKGKRRLALINDRTFAEGETGKVRVGATNVTLRCVEIRGGSVIVQNEASEEKQELLLRTN